MGWSNYVLVSEWGIAFEISRYVEKEDDDSHNYERWCELKKSRENINDESFENKKMTSLTVRDISKLMEVFDKSAFMTWMCDDETLIWFLKMRDIKFEIMNEFDFHKMSSSEKKKYKVINRF